MVCDCWFPCSCVDWSLVKARKIVWESQVIDSSSITQSEVLWVWRCDVKTSNSIQDGGALVVNILVFDLRVQLQHCAYQRKTLLFALIKVSTFICKREISGLSSPLSNVLRSLALRWRVSVFQRGRDNGSVMRMSEGVVYSALPGLWRLSNAFDLRNIFVTVISIFRTLVSGCRPEKKPSSLGFDSRLGQSDNFTQQQWFDFIWINFLIHICAECLCTV